MSWEMWRDMSVEKSQKSPKQFSFIALKPFICFLPGCHQRSPPQTIATVALLLSHLFFFSVVDNVVAIVAGFDHVSICCLPSNTLYVQYNSGGSRWRQLQQKHSDPLDILRSLLAVAICPTACRTSFLSDGLNGAYALCPTTGKELSNNR